MAKHLQVELDQLKKRILVLGAMVEERVRMASKSLIARDHKMAEVVIKTDFEIDEAEVEVEEECLKILALHQPVAIDLRFLSAVIKINNDLERIGDQAVNIAQRASVILKNQPVKADVDFALMAQKTERMLKNSLDALVTFDVDLAYKVCLDDDEVDEIKAKSYDEIKKRIMESPEFAGVYINLLLVSRHLERIADHSTNIAEEVIHLVEGEIPRHRLKLKQDLKQ